MSRCDRLPTVQRAYPTKQATFNTPPTQETFAKTHQSQQYGHFTFKQKLTPPAVPLGPEGVSLYAEIARRLSTISLATPAMWFTKFSQSRTPLDDFL